MRLRISIILLGLGLTCGVLLIGGANPAAGQTIMGVQAITPGRSEPEILHPSRRPLMPLVAKQHTVEISIVDGAAITQVEQVFRNTYQQRIEGTYVFPLPDDVALSKFSMYLNGKEVEGELLTVEEARRAYESIVAKLRDPALLEYVGKRMFRARIFPIEPLSEVRVKLSYSQLLKSEDGLVHYQYPLNATRQLPGTVETLGLVVNLKSKTPIKSVFSPSHTLAVNRKSDHEVSASFEAKNAYPEKEFELYYQLSDKEFGLTVLTYREAGADGFFLARIAPPAFATETDVLPKDICFVLDTSGSMGDDDKMEQAQRALKFCLANLNPQDRFNIIPFSHEPVRFQATLVSAEREQVEAARAYVDKLKPNGGTNINDALLAALEAAPAADETRPYLIVFLTDGLPTIGVTDVDGILANVKAKNSARVRLFAFGVGHDVNTKLLDVLAEQNRGTRDYVQPGEDLELKLSGFYRKVADPVLADLTLNFKGLTVYDMYPPKLADLFAGTELVVTGRYQGEGPKAVELLGTRRGVKERFVYETKFPADAREHSFLPPLWATRKVGYLLDEMRLHGENQELKDAVVKLAMQYGIVTPYTAYLVTEPEQAARGGNILRDALEPLDASRGRASGLPQYKRSIVPAGEGGGGSGKAGVDASQAMRQMREAEEGALDSTYGVPGSFAGRSLGGAETALVKRVDARTFYRVDERWIDAAYEKDSETRKVGLFSEEYFELIRQHPELAKVFALGEQVVVVLDGIAYETVPPKEESPAEP